MNQMDRFRLLGRTALVTGASRGIGRAIALGLAECGAEVVFHCAANVEAAQQAADRAAAMGARAHVVAADLALDDAPQRLYTQAVEQMGRMDILVLNVSVQIRRPWQEITREEFQTQVTINLRASMELMQLALPGMMERGWGRVLTVGSVQQVKPHPQMLVYAATKMGLWSMALNLAKQVAPHGVTVNNLAPGVIDTDRNTEFFVKPGERERIAQGIPVRAIGEPEDCVGAALLLCSNAGRYITGIDLLVDGGMHMP
jgi:glucose 1-dehydrogenase